MILEGKDLQNKNIIKNTKWQNQFQPAGVDLSLESIHEFLSAGVIDGDNSKRKLPEYKQLNWNEQDSIHLPQGAYKIIFNETVEIPKDHAAIARSRSSLLRCGASVQTAVWDPGYKGRSEAMLQISNKAGLTLYKDAKVAQLIFIKLQKEATNTYSGKYQGENI